MRGGGSLEKCSIACLELVVETYANYMVCTAVGFFGIVRCAVCICEVLLIVAVDRCEVAYVEANLVVDVPCTAQAYRVAVAGK